MTISVQAWTVEAGDTIVSIGQPYAVVEVLDSDVGMSKFLLQDEDGERHTTTLPDTALVWVVAQEAVDSPA